jgi:hypothetical protein
MLGKLLCYIGLHRWRQIGMSIFGDPAYMCKRPYCRICKQFFLHAGESTYWQREEILEGDKR